MQSVNQARLHSLPERTHEKYKNVYVAFIRWQKHNENSSFCEQVMLDYFNEVSEKYKPSSLWSIYSMLKSTILYHHNIDISKYSRLIDWLKMKNVGFKSKKSEAFSAEQINKFLAEAPDELYLVCKTVMVFVVAGGCAIDEITKVKTDHVKVYGTEVIVSIPKADTKFPKVFPISGEFAKIVQQYMQLRPANVETDRFFLKYRKGEHQCSVMGKNNVAAVPKEIAKFLKLDPESYNIHSFRRSSAKVLLLPDITTRKKGNKQKSLGHKRIIGEAASDIINLPSSTNGRIESRGSKRLATSTITSNIMVMSQHQDTVRDAPCEVFYEITSLNEQETKIKSEPMLPVTTALMKRKPTLYMGLQQNHFSRLLQLVSERTQLSELKVMLALRKFCLNEKFEVLGDFFDLDKTTTEQYFRESKHLIIDLVNILTTTTPISNHFQVTAEPIIKVEECTNVHVANPIALALIPTPYNYDATTEMNAADHDDVKLNWPESSDFGIPSSEEEPDFLSEDFFPTRLDEADNHDKMKRKRTVECPLCIQSYVPHVLKSHMEQVHLNLYNLNRTICGLCTKKFDTKVLLKAHQKEAHGGGCCACDVCGRIFTAKSTIRLHILTKHSQLRTHLCHTCGEGFPIPSLLTSHVKRKHEKVFGHECQLCDMKFMSAASLKLHFSARHTDERPYFCEAKGCGKTFKWPLSLTLHKRVHSDDKYVCCICSKQFSFKNCLYSHLRTIHNQIINSK